jgi:protein-L-isoaspartate(D-aspartate) O-methyltransferase
MVAIMNEALQLIPGLTVLEVGAGSGYHAATIAEIIGPHGHVYTVEIVEDLVRSARANLEKAGYTDRVTLVLGDGSLGYPDRALYHRILLTAASPEIPNHLIDQLRIGGTMLAPVGGRFFPQELVSIMKKSQSEVEKRELGGVAFVPLKGKHGFSD